MLLPLLTYARGARRTLLRDRKRAGQMGAAAEERVRARFLGTRSLLDYLELVRPLRTR